MSPYEDLRAAIHEHALVHASPKTTIFQTEEGALGSWIFDFRALLLRPQWLDRYAEIFWERYASHYPFQVCAMESAGIALVSAIVMKSVERGTPVNGFFVRKSRKRKGLTKFIEGIVTEEPIIMVDDLINFGSTLEKLLKILEPVHAGTKEYFALLAFRDTSAYASFFARGIKISSLFTLEDFDLPLQSPDSPAIPADLFETRWKFSAKDPSFNLVVQKSTPVIDGERVYFGTDAGIFYALNQADGSIAWSFKVGKHPRGKGILSSSALYAGVIFFGAYDGNVYALEAATGAKRWVYSEADWVGSSPAVAPDLNFLFIGLEFGLFRKRGGIAAIDLATGKEAWKDVTAALTHGSPLYIKQENMVVIGSNDGVLYAYDARSGTLLWRYQSRGDIKTSPTYDPQQRIVVFASMDGAIYAVSARDGIPRFAFETSGGIYSTPLVHENLVYITSLDKTVYAIDLDTGKEHAQFETNGRIFASPTIIGESLWIGSNDGKLYELAPETLKLRSSQQFSERIVNRIVCNEKTKDLFVPTVANEIYCLTRKRQS